jgi:hypothetical protein
LTASLRGAQATPEECLDAESYESLWGHGENSIPVLAWWYPQKRENKSEEKTCAALTKAHAADMGVCNPRDESNCMGR